MKAVLPPPERVKDVETAIGAARAEQRSLANALRLGVRPGSAGVLACLQYLARYL
jgi:hypothetical protein